MKNTDFYQKFFLPIVFIVQIIVTAFFLINVNKVFEIETEQPQKVIQQTQKQGTDAVTTNKSISPKEIVNNSVIIKDSSGNIIGTGFFVSENKIATGIHVVTSDTNGEDREVTILSGNKVISNNQIIDRKKFDQDIMILTLKDFKSNSYIEVSPGDYEIGDYVGAVCNINGDVGLTLSYISGTISADRREITLSGGGTYNNLLQINMLIEKGCSGGPVVTKDGKAIGVVFAKIKDINGIGLVVKFSPATYNYIKQ